MPRHQRAPAADRLPGHHPPGDAGARAPGLLGHAGRHLRHPRAARRPGDHRAGDVETMPRPLVTVSPRRRRARPTRRSRTRTSSTWGRRSTPGGTATCRRRRSGSRRPPATTSSASCWRCTGSCTRRSSTRRAPPTSVSTSTRSSRRPRACARTTPTWRSPSAAAPGSPPGTCPGYLFASSDATGADVDGDEVQVQTHAWFEAAIPDWGWLALDPTNAQQVGQRHIAIGHGRDYDDVPPVRGVYSGGAALQHRRPRADAPARRRHLPGAGPAAAVTGRPGAGAMVSRRRSARGAQPPIGQ